MDKETGAVLLVIVCLLAGVVVAQPLFPSNNSHYSELGVLGPQQKLAGYPTTVGANQAFILYAYIGNHEGGVSYYSLLVKLGNKSTITSNSTSANAPIIAKFSYILSDGDNTTFPMGLSISNSGTNQRLIFELWSYDTNASGFAYTGLWNQLWLNVTSA